MDIKKLWNFLLKRYRTGADNTIIINKEQFVESIYKIQQTRDNKKLIFTFKE